MIKGQKITSINDKRAMCRIHVESCKALNVEDLEEAEDKMWETQTSEGDNDTCENEGPVDWPDDDSRWGNPPTVR